MKTLCPPFTILLLLVARAVQYSCKEWSCLAVSLCLWLELGEDSIRLQRGVFCLCEWQRPDKRDLLCFLWNLTRNAHLKCYFWAFVYMSAADESRLRFVFLSEEIKVSWEETELLGSDEMAQRLRAPVIFRRTPVWYQHPTVVGSEPPVTPALLPSSGLLEHPHTSDFHLHTHIKIKVIEINI